jgi:hypothetical protein
MYMSFFKARYGFGSSAKKSLSKVFDAEYFSSSKWLELFMELFC